MHGLAHISLAFLLSLFFNLNPLPTILGSLLPDIDSPFTMIGRLFPWISYRLNEKFGHRTLTHSWIPLSFLLIFYLIFQESFMLHFLIGYASHIFLDMLNKNGVMLFYPRRVCFTLIDIS